LCAWNSLALYAGCVSPRQHATHLSLLGKQGSADAMRKASERLADAKCAAPSLFFHPPALSSFRVAPPHRTHASAKAQSPPDGVTLDPPWLAWLNAIADQSHEFEPVAAISWLELRTYMPAPSCATPTPSAWPVARSPRPASRHTLVEFMCALPDEARVRPETPKPPSRRARRLAPPRILLQKKRTFTLPWEMDAHRPPPPHVEASFSTLAQR